MTASLKFLRRTLTQRIQDTSDAVLGGGISHEEYLRLTAKIQAYRECLSEVSQAENAAEDHDFDMPGATAINIG